MDIANEIKQRRKKFELSQAQLSYLSGVSLPTIQNIESGRANPTIDVIQKLGEALRFQIQITDSVDTHSHHEKQKNEFIKKTQADMAQLLLLSDREKDELIALLFALKTHYSYAFKKYFSKNKNAKRLMDIYLKEKLGRMIKLRRIMMHKVAPLF